MWVFSVEVEDDVPKPSDADFKVSRKAVPVIASILS
jgi:hypothetical protein